MDLAGLCFVMRGKDDTVLDHPVVQARLPLPPDAHLSRPESALVRTLYDCPDVPVGKTGCRCRVVVATHPKGPMKSRVGVTRKSIVYELFFTHGLRNELHFRLRELHRLVQSSRFSLARDQK